MPDLRYKKFVSPWVELGLRSDPSTGARKEAVLPVHPKRGGKEGVRSPQRGPHREARFLLFEFPPGFSAFQGSLWSTTQRLATRFTPSSFFQRGVFATES